jgi:hypothetical protein
MRNDVLSGVLVAKDTTVTFYQNGDFSGWNKTIEGPAKYCNVATIPGFHND